MFTQYNNDTHKTEWILNSWWQKTFYVIGFIYGILFAIGFVAGFIAAIQ